MFFKKSNSAQEIEASVLESLPEPPQSEEDGIHIALQSLADSAELFEKLNLTDEAEVITQFIETIASGQFAMVKEAKKRAKKKTKTKSKKSKKSKTKSDSNQLLNNLNPTILEIIQDKSIDNLTPEKELDNLANIGWVFNAPKPDCSDCSMADDGEEPMSYEKCSECGFDHVHEPEESFDAHFPPKAEIIPEELEDEYLLNSIDA